MFWPKMQKWVFVSFVVLVVILGILYLIFEDGISTETLRETVKNFGIWAPLIFIIIYTMGTIFIPSTPFMLAAGILFGFWYGLLYTVIAGFISAIIVFRTSRKLGKFWVETILEHKYMELLKTYNQRLEKGPIWDLILWRVAPMPFNILNILMGVSRISLKDYALGTFLGLIPSNVITVYAGVLISKIF